MGQMCCNCGHWEERGTDIERTDHGVHILDKRGACLENGLLTQILPRLRPGLTAAGQTCREWKPSCAEAEPPYMGNSGMSIDDVESIGGMGECLTH